MSPSRGRYHEDRVGVPCCPLRHFARTARIQFELFPEVTHMSTIIFLMWIVLPTRVDTVEPPVMDPVIQFEESVVEMLAGAIAISRCLCSTIPRLDNSLASVGLFFLELAFLRRLVRRGMVRVSGKLGYKR